MPKFNYKAKKTSGEWVEGELESANKSGAYALLQRQGFFPTLLEESKDQAVSETGHWVYSKKIKWKDIANFTRGLADLLDSGVPLSRALTILKDEVTHRALKNLIQVLHEEVLGGSSFSSALAKHPRVFSSLYTNLIYSGETSGTLPTVLNELNSFFEQEEELKGKIQVAMAYPLLMLGVGAITIGILLVFIIPKIVSVFVTMGETLPIPTQILLAISQFLRQRWWFVLVCLFSAGVITRQLYRSTQGKYWIDRVKLSLPLFKDLELKSEISRFCRTLSSMLHNGIPIMTAIHVSNDIVMNQVIAREIASLHGQIKEGESLSEAVARCKTFPKDVKGVIAVGEESGHLEQTLGKVGMRYLREVNQSVKIMTSLLEPAMILFLGSLVGFIVIAMLLPIFEISLVVAQ